MGDWEAGEDLAVPPTLSVKGADSRPWIVVLEIS